MTSPINVSDSEFQEKVLDSNVPVIVDFWAPWCGPCRMIAPILEKIAQDYDYNLVVAKINIDENSEWAIRLGVHSIPTLLFVENGEVVNRIVGAAPAPVIEEAILESFQNKLKVVEMAL